LSPRVQDLDTAARVRWLAPPCLLPIASLRAGRRTRRNQVRRCRSRRWRPDQLTDLPIRRTRPVAWHAPSTVMPWAQAGPLPKPAP